MRFNNRFFPYVLLLLLFFININYSQSTKLDFELKSYINRVSENTMIHLLVKGNKQSIAEFVIKNRGVFKYSTGEWCSILISARKIEELSNKDFVENFEFSLSSGQQLNDSMLVKNNITPIHLGDNPLNQPYTGAGVVVGFIDTGLDFNHGDFLDDSGNTRVLSIWDQAQPYDSLRTPPDYGYGQVWDSTDINSGICTHVANGSHGTHVTGIATGNANANGLFKGIAPATNLVVVRSDFNAANWKVTVADAAKFIFDVAESYNMPCVINASVGDYYGTHDGEDAASKIIDSLLVAKRGRSFVCAAGNLGNAAWHLGYDVTSDTNFTWFKYNASSYLGYGALFFELWADTADFNNVWYSIGVDKTSPNYEYRGNIDFRKINSTLSTVLTDTLKNSSGDILAIIDTYGELIDDKYFLQVHSHEPDSSNYNFRFITTGSGKFDVWSYSPFGTSEIVESPLPSVSTYSPMSYYKSPDSSKTIVDAWACSDKVITVGNYYSRTAYLDYDTVLQAVTDTSGKIVENSSLGPSRKGITKPDVSATGNTTLSAGKLSDLSYLVTAEPFKLGQGGMHLRSGGTSSAAPVVAGIAALLLEKCPTASYEEIKNAIINTSQTDDFTGVVPNNTWGNGKVDGFEALLYPISNPLIYVNPSDEFCEGDSVSIGVSEGAQFQWSNGDSLSDFYVNSSGFFYATVIDAAGCSYYTDSLTILEHPLPETPTVTFFESTLYSSVGFSNEWYLEDVIILGANDSSYIPTTTGNYYVIHTDTNGCSATSEPIFVDFSSFEDIFLEQSIYIYPNPANQYVQINWIGEGEVKLTGITDYLGKSLVFSSIKNKNSILVDTSSLENCYYFLSLLLDDKRVIKKMMIYR